MTEGMTMSWFVIPVEEGMTIPLIVIPKSNGMTILEIVIPFQPLASKSHCHAALSYRSLYGMTILLIVIPTHL